MISSAEPSGPLTAEVLSALRCSVCGDSVTVVDRSVRCPQRHSFDIARQGYVNLLRSGVSAGTADTPEMVRARREFLAAKHFEPLADEIARVVAEITVPGLILDAGGGVGYYLGHALAHAPQSVGLVLDVSAHAVKHATRAHARIDAVVWNLWQPWPVATESAAVILNIFAPRNVDEFHRVLRHDGTLIIVSPQPDHLRELARAVDTLTVDEHKEDRLRVVLADKFAQIQTKHISCRMSLSTEDIVRAVLMGPTAHHLDRADRRAKLAALIGPMDVTSSFLLSVYQPRKLDT